MAGLIEKLVHYQKKRYSKGARISLTILFPVFFMLYLAAAVLPAYLLREWLAVPFGLDRPVRLYLGASVAAAGLLLYLWTIVLFAKAGGTQVPLVPTQKLVTTGPYALSRNPMFTGAGILILGVGIMLNSVSFVLLSTPVPIAYLIYIKLVEEKELEARFGEEYVAYKRKTPFLIPWFRGKK